MTAVIWRGILIPFLGTALGRGLRIFYAQRIKRFAAPRDDRLCGRRYDGGFGLEPC